MLEIISINQSKINRWSDNVNVNIEFILTITKKLIEMLGNLNISQKDDRSLLKILRKSFSQAIAIAFSKDSSFRDYRRSKVFVDETEYETIKEIIKSHLSNTLSNIEAAFLEAKNSNEFIIKTQNELEINLEETLDFIFPELSTNFQDQIDNSKLRSNSLIPS